MASLQILSSSSNFFSYSNKQPISVSISISNSSLNLHSSNVSYLKNSQIVLPKHQKKKILIDQLNILTTKTNQITITKDQNDGLALKLHTIMEFITDRIEMHKNIGEKRQNWNSLLLNSVNMMTLTASTMAGLCGVETPNLALKISSIFLFLSATRVLMIMNKIQPSQLVEEQRNAVRLFKQLRSHIQTILSLKNATKSDVNDALKRVLALDRAYPLPLLGGMIEKFPKEFNPSVWWPLKDSSRQRLNVINVEKRMSFNGWNEKLEEEMKEIMRVIKGKDFEDYVRLGNNALKLNKLLAISGPLLTGIAALGSGFLGLGGPWAGVVAAVAGALAAIVNTIEHGGQVGMVFEMYRNCGGFFRLLEETIESTLEEGDLSKRENGELFEMKMALHLGRSLSELRDLAAKSRENGGCVNEFASKLF